MPDRSSRDTADEPLPDARLAGRPIPSLALIADQRNLDQQFSLLSHIHPHHHAASSK
jgi:hypothetical protein